MPQRRERRADYVAQAAAEVLVLEKLGESWPKFSGVGADRLKSASWSDRTEPVCLAGAVHDHIVLRLHELAAQLLPQSLEVIRHEPHVLQCMCRAGVGFERWT